MNKKIIITETQLKVILENNLNEQKSKMIPSGGSAEGIVKIINGKYMVIAKSEMGNEEKLGPFIFKVPVKNGQPVHVTVEKNMVVIFGSDPKNPKGKNIRYN